MINTISTYCISNSITDNDEKKAEPPSIEFIETAIANHAAVLPELVSTVTVDNIQICIKGMQAEKKRAGAILKRMATYQFSLLYLGGWANNNDMVDQICSGTDDISEEMNFLYTELEKWMYDKSLFPQLTVEEKEKVINEARQTALETSQETIDDNIRYLSNGKGCGDSDGKENEKGGDKTGNGNNNETGKLVTQKKSNSSKGKTVANKTRVQQSMSKSESESESEDEPEGIDKMMQAITTSEGGIYKELRQKFNALDDGQLLAVETKLLLLVSAQIEAAFSPNKPCLDRVAGLSNNLLDVVRPLSSIKLVLTKQLEIEVFNEKASLIDLGTGKNTTWGAVALQCEVAETSKKKELPAELAKHLSEVTAAVERLGKKEKLNNLVRFGHELTNLISNCVHLCIGIEACNTLSMNDLLSNVDSGAKKTKPKETELKRRATSLAKQVTGSAFDFNGKVLDYLVTVLFPGLRKDETRKLAIDVAHDIKKYFTQTGADERYNIISNAFKKGQGEDGVDYCAGKKRSFSTRRNRIVTLLIDLVLHVEIKRRLPPGLFDQGFVHCILCSSPSNINAACNFDLSFFANDYHDDESNVVKKIKEKEMTSHPKANQPRVVIIEHVKQIECLINLSQLH